MKKKFIYKICGFLGILGSIAVVITDLIGIAVHEDHNPVKNTISMLAIGKYGWIQDLGLDFLAIGFAAVSVGLFIWKRRGTKWILSLIIQILIAIDIILIAEHNQYAVQSENTIHRKLVYVLAGLFLILNILISQDLKSLKGFLKKFCLWIAALWLVFAPLLPLIPDSLNGAYERLICSLIVIWLGTVAYYLYHIPAINESE